MSHPHPAPARPHEHGPHEHGSLGHGHEHSPHEHGHEHGHSHGRGRGLAGLAGRVAHRHSHAPAGVYDHVLESSAEGMRALWASLAILGVTAALQAAVVVLSGSVALLGDTVHNAADALTAIPLAVAFTLARRPPTRRYTYGYGRAEDLAGLAVIVAVLVSSALTCAQALARLVHPQPVSHLGVVAGAALIGAAGNEFAARRRIRTGRAIGSAALVADGMHARADGLASLAVLAGAAGAALGWRQADPAMGLVITAAIALSVRQPARELWQRLMDAVDPALVDAAVAALRDTPGVLGVGEVRLRWTGRLLRGDCEITVAPASSAAQIQQVAADAAHALRHALPRLAAPLIHVTPC